jgi:hypothetical protein
MASSFFSLQPLNDHQVKPFSPIQGFQGLLNRLQLKYRTGYLFFQSRKLCAVFRVRIRIWVRSWTGSKAGWLHDRIRVVASSFFVNVLQLPWRWGMKYFWDTLLDADLESDALGWQYITGSLPESQEPDRIDNPQVRRVCNC